MKCPNFKNRHYNVMVIKCSWTDLYFWSLLLVVYLLLLCAIGYVSFWEQDVNNPDHSTGAYLRLLDTKVAHNNENQEYSAEVKAMINEYFKMVIKEVMSKNSDGAVDLQNFAL